MLYSSLVLHGVLLMTLMHGILLMTLIYRERVFRLTPHESWLDFCVLCSLSYVYDLWLWLHRLEKKEMFLYLIKKTNVGIDQTSYYDTVCIRQCPFLETNSTCPELIHSKQIDLILLGCITCLCTWFVGLTWLGDGEANGLTYS